MFETENYFLYLLLMAGVTYLVRAVPLVLMRGRFTGTRVRSFFFYMPYAVLSVMTVPAVFTASGTLVSSLSGFAAALFLGYREKSLILVAVGTVLATLAAEGVLLLIG